MINTKSISIIGAGIGGLAIAIMLARSGHKITIFEKFKEAKQLGSGFLLQPPGQEILRSLGLYENIEAQSKITTALISKTPEDKAILDLHYTDLDGEACTGLGVRRHVLHSALLNAAIAEDVQFIWGADINNLDKDAGFVEEASGTHGPYDHIILATGARDALPDSYIIRTHRKYAWSCLWANVTLLSSLPQDVLSQRVKTARYMLGLSPIGLMANGKTEAAFFWSLPHKTVSAWKAQSYESFTA